MAQWHVLKWLSFLALICLHRTALCCRWEMWPNQGKPAGFKLYEQSVEHLNLLPASVQLVERLSPPHFQLWKAYSRHLHIDFHLSHNFPALSSSYPPTFSLSFLSQSADRFQDPLFFLYTSFHTAQLKRVGRQVYGNLAETMREKIE